MRKKIALLVAAMMVSLASHAQFEQGKVYIGATLSNVDFSNNGIMGNHFDIGAKVGYFFWDNIDLTAQFNYEYYKDQFDIFTAGVGGRYHITQNGLYVGASFNMMAYDDVDFAPSVQLGYTFFLSKTVTIEPEIYYNQSLTNHSDFSTVGFRIGFGVYLDDLF